MGGPGHTPSPTAEPFGDAGRIERLGARFWPSAHGEERDGWLLRATPGFHRWRNNAALPLVPDGGPLDVVEEWAERWAEPPTVQVAPSEANAGLDAELERRGYERRIDVDVLVAGTAAVAASADAGAVEIRDRWDDEWLAAWEAAEGRDDVAEHSDLVFPHFTDRTAFALAPGGAGVGLAVAGDGWGAIFCMATHPAARGRGVGAAVLAALAAWAPAERLFLQVAPGNASAQRLYARAGFGRSHGYHFRIRR